MIASTSLPLHSLRRRLTCSTLGRPTIMLRTGSRLCQRRSTFLSSLWILNPIGRLSKVGYTLSILHLMDCTQLGRFLFPDFPSRTFLDHIVEIAQAQVESNLGKDKKHLVLIADLEGSVAELEESLNPLRVKLSHRLNKTARRSPRRRSRSAATSETRCVYLIPSLLLPCFMGIGSHSFIYQSLLTPAFPFSTVQNRNACAFRLPLSTAMQSRRSRAPL